MPIVADNGTLSSPPRISEREREREIQRSISDRRTRRSRRSFGDSSWDIRASEGSFARIFDEPRNGVTPKRPLPRTNRIQWRTGTERMRATPRISTRYANQSINQRGHLGLPIHYRNGSCQLARASPRTLDLLSRAARSRGASRERNWSDV